MRKLKYKPATWSVTQILNSPKWREVFPNGLLSTKFDVSIKIAKSRLDFYKENGTMSRSFTKVRNKFNIPILNFKEDFYSGGDNGDVNIWTFSRWLSFQSEEQITRLMGAVVKELVRLELPLTLTENYLASLLYNTPIRAVMLPTTMFGDLSALSEKFGSLPLTTEDKDNMIAAFRQFHQLPNKGRIPKQILPDWERFQKIFLSGKNKNRTLRRNDYRRIASEAKIKVKAENPKSGRFTLLKKETDKEKFEKYWPVNLSNFSGEELKLKSKRGAANLRKHRERLGKLKK